MGLGWTRLNWIDDFEGIKEGNATWKRGLYIYIYIYIGLIPFFYKA